MHFKKLSLLAFWRVFKMLTIHPWELYRRSHLYYPSSPHMRRQWVKQTVDLYKRGKHRLQIGVVNKREEISSGI